MALVEDIQSALKAGKVIIGYNESVKFIKTAKPKLIVIADNLPEDRKEAVERDAGASGVEVRVFDGDSTQLGLICGKSFPISILVVK